MQAWAFLVCGGNIASDAFAFRSIDQIWQPGIRIRSHYLPMVSKAPLKQSPPPNGCLLSMSPCCGQNHPSTCLLGR